MEHELYNYSLCVSLTLMVFFALYFIWGQVPSKPAYQQYRRSRIIMGIALLVLVANYLVHLLVQIRFIDRGYAIFMNLSTYYLEAWLFSCALTSLLDFDYLTRRRFASHLISWLIYTLFWGTVALLMKGKEARFITLLLMAGWFVIYAYRLARRLMVTYHRAVTACDNYHSEHIALYIQWLSRFTYWAVIFGVAVGLLTFLPDRLVFIWILSAIPFYIYLYCSYMNYLLFCEEVGEILSRDMQWEKELREEENNEETVDSGEGRDEHRRSYCEALSPQIEQWVARKGFTRQGLTIADLADEMETNRTYLYEYFKNMHNLTFREWVNRQRLQYAEKLLIDRPELTVSDIAHMAGYISLSYFTKTFTQAKGITPARWRKETTSHQ